MIICTILSFEGVGFLSGICLVAIKYVSDESCCLFTRPEAAKSKPRRRQNTFRSSPYLCWYQHSSSRPELCIFPNIERYNLLHSNCLCQIDASDGTSDHVNSCKQVGHILGTDVSAWVTRSKVASCLPTALISKVAKPYPGRPLENTTLCKTDVEHCQFRDFSSPLWRSFRRTNNEQSILISKCE